MIIISIFEDVALVLNAQDSTSKTLKLSDMTFEIKNEIIETTDFEVNKNRTFETGPGVTITIKGTRT